MFSFGEASRLGFSHSPNPTKPMHVLGAIYSGDALGTTQLHEVYFSTLMCVYAIRRYTGIPSPTLWILLSGFPDWFIKAPRLLWGARSVIVTDL